MDATIAEKNAQLSYGKNKVALEAFNEAAEEWRENEVDHVIYKYVSEYCWFSDYC
jgi:hypothetical protein